MKRNFYNEKIKIAQERKKIEEERRNLKEYLVFSYINNYI